MTISDDEAKKLGKELSSQNPLAVYGMASKSTTLGAGFAISSAAVTAVRTDGCELRVTLCRGDLCEMKRPFYKFQTPLKTSQDLSDRIASQVLPNVCAPNPLWLVTDPAALLVLIICGACFYGLYVGVDAVEDALVAAPNLEKTIGMVFGSSRNFGNAAVAGAWFAIVAHVLEASVVLYWCVKSLQLGAATSLHWAFLASLVGYPVLSRLKLLVEIEQGHDKSK